jgi:hypothetical protein
LVKKIIFQIKLTNPFAINNKEETHNKKIGIAKKMEKIKNIDEEKSIMLKTSPVKRNKLFTKRRPPQKTIRGFTLIPKTIIKKTLEDKISIPPKILTNIF